MKMTEADRYLGYGLCSYFGLKGSRQSSPGIQGLILLYLWRQTAFEHYSTISRAVGYSGGLGTLRVYVHFLRQGLGGIEMIECKDGWFRLSEEGRREVDEALEDIHSIILEALHYKDYRNGRGVSPAVIPSKKPLSERKLGKNTKARKRVAA